MTDMLDFPGLVIPDEDDILELLEDAFIDNKERVTEPQLHQVAQPEKTDAEIMQEAIAKYKGDSRVEKVVPMRIRRDDGSIYIRPHILLKPDLTMGSLVFPGSNPFASRFF